MGVAHLRNCPKRKDGVTETRNGDFGINFLMQVSYERGLNADKNYVLILSFDPMLKNLGIISEDLAICPFQFLYK